MKVINYHLSTVVASGEIYREVKAMTDERFDIIGDMAPVYAKIKTKDLKMPIIFKFGYAKK